MTEKKSVMFAQKVEAKIALVGYVSKPTQHNG